MYPAAPDNKKQKIVASFIVILAVVLVTAGVEAYDGKQKSVGTSLVTSPSTSSSQTSSSATSSNSSTSTSNNTSSPYKDGTYSASSDYYVPNSIESIKVTLTIKSGIVTDSRLQNSENNGESAAYQQAFTSEYRGYVVGKSIASIRLSYVAGASDTTQGFNDALDQIKSQAQA